MQEFLCWTLLHIQQEQLCVEKSLWEVVQQSVELLREKGFITSDPDGGALQVTRLGAATYKGRPPCCRCRGTQDVRDQYQCFNRLRGRNKSKTLRLNGLQIGRGGRTHSFLCGARHENISVLRQAEHSAQGWHARPCSMLKLKRVKLGRSAL